MGIFADVNSSLYTGKGHGLDPKHTQSFNSTTVANHFIQLAQVIKEYAIPPQTVYNWNKKGIQLGGSHKGINTHYSFACANRDWYIMQSDNLNT